MKSAVLPAVLLLALSACVPNKAYRVPVSTYQFHFPEDGRYFRDGSAGLAFIEFDKHGQLFDSKQVDAAVRLIGDFNQLDPARGAFVFVFIHGWKNNASEAAGNVWGFRKALDELACISRGRPILGVYIGWPGVGWPGQNSGFLQNVSFSDRESVAYQVGGAPLTNTLVKIMQATKGPDYAGPASCILVGHSFGGVALEHAITPVLQQHLDQMSAGTESRPPADLILLLNEAGAARLAQPFLYYLHDHNITYEDGRGVPHPLLLSMTSAGDVATKFAFPGGQFISPHRPGDLKTFPQPDAFGLASEKPYYLLTTANTVALQNHQFVQRPAESLEVTPKSAYVSAAVGPRVIFDMLPKDSLNHTPYWVSQLPQVFVPDHGSAFGFQFMRLLTGLLCTSQLTCDISKESLTLKPACTASPLRRGASANESFELPDAVAAPPAGPPPMKIMLKKKQ